MDAAALNSKLAAGRQPGCCHSWLFSLGLLGPRLKFSIRSWILYILLGCVVLMMFLILEKVQKFYSPEFYLPAAIDPFFSKLNRTVFLIWVGTTPIRPVGLATVDSIARHLPDWRMEYHFTKEVGIPDDIYATRKKNIKTQIDFFKRNGVKIDSIIHEDIEKDLKGTVFDGVGIKQEHVAGLYGVKPGDTFGGHVSDLLRVLFSLPTGGMYFDEDNLVMANLEPLVARYGPTMMGAGEREERAENCKDFTPQNSWFTLTANDPFFLEASYRMRKTVQELGPDCLFAYRPELWSDKCPWTVVGPRSFHAAHNHFCETHLAEVVNPGELPNELLPRQSLSPFMEPTPTVIATAGPSQQLHLRRPPNRPRLYTIMTRRYLMPGHWRDLGFLTDQGDQALPRFEALSVAYMFHVFDPIKDPYLDYILNVTQYPVLQRAHELSCKFLCRVEDYRHFSGFD